MVEETDIVLELSHGEAVFLYRLLGHHIVGIGPDRQLSNDIFQALRGVIDGEYEGLNTEVAFDCISLR